MYMHMYTYVLAYMHWHSSSLGFTYGLVSRTGMCFFSCLERCSNPGFDTGPAQVEPDFPLASWRLGFQPWLLLFYGAWARQIGEFLGLEEDLDCRGGLTDGCLSKEDKDGSCLLVPRGQPETCGLCWLHSFTQEAAHLETTFHKLSSARRGYMGGGCF